MPLDKSYVNLADMDPNQAGQAYMQYLNQMKKLGAQEIMTVEQFAQTGAYKQYRTAPLLKRKAGYNTMATTDKTQQLQNAGLNQNEIGSLRR